ncbi:MAG: NTP transferase domain-containing protein [Acidimicrobiia bacterium]
MILAVLQARMSSSRLPGKVLADVLGRPMIERQVERLARSTRLDHLVVATSTDPSDDPLASWCERAGVAVHRGPLDDVLGRFLGACRPIAPRHVVRLTGDCPLADPAVIDALIARHLDGGHDYSSNCWEPTFPHGMDAEVVTAAWLERLDLLARSPWEREHVTVWFRAHAGEISLGELRCEPPRPDLRLTVDHAADLAVVRRVYEALYPGDPAFTMAEVIALLDAHPEIRALNADATSVRLDGALVVGGPGWPSPAA